MNNLRMWHGPLLHPQPDAAHQNQCDARPAHARRDPPPPHSARLTLRKLQNLLAPFAPARGKVHRVVRFISHHERPPATHREPPRATRPAPAATADRPRPATVPPPPRSATASSAAR